MGVVGPLLACSSHFPSPPNENPIPILHPCRRRRSRSTPYPRASTGPLLSCSSPPLPTPLISTSSPPLDPVGAEEIKEHAFFKGINWALLRHEPPPYIPKRQSKSSPPSTLE
jgi:hypothetical protein